MDKENGKWPGRPTLRCGLGQPRNTKAQLLIFVCLSLSLWTLWWREPKYIYPLALNQYINDSPGIFSCIRTRAACIRTEINSPKLF